MIADTPASTSGEDGEPHGPAQLPAQLAEVDPASKLVLAKVHPRSRSHAAADSEGDCRREDERVTAGYQSGPHLRRRERQTGDAQPRALGQKLVDPMEAGGSSHQHDLTQGRGIGGSGGGFQGTQRSHHLPGELVHYRDAGRGFLAAGAPEDPLGDLAPFRLHLSDPMLSRQGFGDGQTRDRDGTGGGRPPVHAQAKGGLAVTDVHQEAGSLEVEDRGQVRQHQPLRLHGSRIDPGFPDRIEEQCDLGARCQRRRHLGALALVADDLPIDEEVLQVEGHLGVDLEWDGGADLAPVPEGEGQAPGGDPVTRQAHHHVFGGEVVHLDEIAELAGQGG